MALRQRDRSYQEQGPGFLGHSSPTPVETPESHMNREQGDGKVHSLQDDWVGGLGQHGGLSLSSLMNSWREDLALSLTV